MAANEIMCCAYQRGTVDVYVDRRPILYLSRPRREKPIGARQKKIYFKTNGPEVRLKFRNSDRPRPGLLVTGNGTAHGT